jgi:hypothetical protein
VVSIPYVCNTLSKQRLDQFSPINYSFVVLMCTGKRNKSMTKQLSKPLSKFLEYTFLSRKKRKEKERKDAEDEEGEEDT